MKQSHQNQLISSSEALLLRIWAYEKPLSGVAGSGLERAEQDAGRRKAWRTQCPLRGEAIRKASQLVILTKLLVRISILVAVNLSPSRERSEGLDHAHS